MAEDCSARLPLRGVEAHGGAQVSHLQPHLKTINPTCLKKKIKNQKTAPQCVGYLFLVSILLCCMPIDFSIVKDMTHKNLGSKARAVKDAKKKKKKSFFTNHLSMMLCEGPTQTSGVRSTGRHPGSTM